MRSKLATLHELQTVYSVRDLYDLVEIAAVDGYNRNLLEKRAAEAARREREG